MEIWANCYVGVKNSNKNTSGKCKLIVVGSKKSLASESKFLKWNLFGEMEIYAHFWPEAKALIIDCASRVLKVSMRCFMWRKLGFFRVIALCFTHVKCGNIMSGFWECYVIAGKVIYCVIWWRRWQTKRRCVVELVLPEYCQAQKHFMNV